MTSESNSPSPTATFSPQAGRPWWITVSEKHQTPDLSSKEASDNPELVVEYTN